MKILDECKLEQLCIEVLCIDGKDHRSNKYARCLESPSFKRISILNDMQDALFVLTNYVMLVISSLSIG